MKTYAVNTWSEVKEAFQSITQDRLELSKGLGLSPRPSSFLYRGQGNSDWQLETTLERMVRKPVWPDFPGYEYMIYLRHHGFPSPLLDWTRSPYVAAYFAYTKLPDDGDNVAIYCYSETAGVGKSWSSSEPTIAVRGPYVRSHRRHFLQQCEYTVCSRFDSNGLCFAHHEDAFGLGKPDQDLLWKIIAPRSIAATALKDLDSMNVNALSLMGSEDALIETLGVREYLFRDA